MIYEKATRGRPSKYKPEYCDLIVQAGENGKSAPWFAASIGVSPATLQGWLVIHHDFKQAMDDAKAAELRWWEDRGQLGAFGEVRGFNAVAWIFSMKCRFRKFGYNDGGDRNAEVEERDAKKLTKEELIEFTKQARANAAEKKEGA